MVDQCYNCEIPNKFMYDPDSEFYFTCSDCPCYTCADIHTCEGKCYEMRKEK